MAAVEAGIETAETWKEIEAAFNEKQPAHFQPYRGALAKNTFEEYLPCQTINYKQPFLILISIRLRISFLDMQEFSHPVQAPPEDYLRLTPLTEGLPDS